MTALSPHPSLFPLSWLYGLAVGVRNAGFDWGLFSVHRLGVPVISVGNLTAGGTGKTPLVVELVRRLQERKVRVGVVSRGYGRTTKGCVVVSDGKRTLVEVSKGGDEPVMLAGRLPGAIIIVAERRAVAAELAIHRFGVDIIVMDDGYQHRGLGRDLNILAVDGSRDLSAERLLPAGLRREPLRALRRAGIVVVTKISTQEQVDHCRTRLQRWFPGQMVGAKTALCGVTRATPGGPVAATLPARPFAFSGIGSPAGFETWLVESGVQLRGSVRFPDHHRYAPDDLSSVEEDARAAGADALVTTEKDAVRLIDAGFLGASFGIRLPLFWVNIGLEFLDGGALLSSHLDRVLDAKPRS